MPSSSPDARDAPRQILDHDRGEAERQLIHQQQLGLADDGAAERQHLALATGQQPRDPRAQRRQCREELEHQRFEVAPFGGSGATRGGDGQILGDRQVGKDLVALRHQHDAARGIGVRRLVLDASPGEADAAGGDAGVVEADEAGDGAERRGLAGAVVADQRDDGLRHNAERDAMQRHRDTVIGDLKAVDGKKRLGHDAGPARREKNACLMRRQMPIRPAGSSSRNRIMTTPKAA